MDQTNQQIRDWVIKRLRVITKETGIQQASLLAGFLENNVNMDPWNMGPEMDECSELGQCIVEEDEPFSTNLDT